MVTQTHEDVFSGTWKANHEKSQLDPNHRFRQATMRLQRYEHGYDLRAEGIGPDGQPCVDACSINLDIGEHPDPRVPRVTVIATRPEANTIDVKATQDGRLVGHANYSVSADGKTLTAATSGTDAAGRTFKTLVVFDRE